VVIQLANRSVAHPVGLVDNVLVHVSELIFLADFYTLDMEEGFSHGYAPIILDRQFLKTTRTKIDVLVVTLSMEFDDIMVHFNILNAMKHTLKDHFVFHVHIIDDVVDGHVSDFHPLHSMKYSSVSELFEFSCIDVDCDFGSDFDYDVDSLFDYLDVVPIDFDITWSKCINHVPRSTYAYDFHVEVQVMEPLSPSPQVLAIQQSPNTLKLKPLPDSLKYVYMEDEERLPIITSTSLIVEQGQRLL